MIRGGVGEDKAAQVMLKSILRPLRVFIVIHGVLWSGRAELFALFIMPSNG